MIIPMLDTLPGLEIADIRQNFTIGTADSEVAEQLVGVMRRVVRDDADTAEVEQPGAGGLDRLAHAADPVGWQIVHDHHVAGRELARPRSVWLSAIVIPPDCNARSALRGLAPADTFCTRRSLETTNSTPPEMTGVVIDSRPVRERPLRVRGRHGDRGDEWWRCDHNLPFGIGQDGARSGRLVAE
jgi:hypothetical protein